MPNIRILILETNAILNLKRFYLFFVPDINIKSVPDTVIAPVINSLTRILMAMVILINRKGLRPVTGLPGIVCLLLIIGSLVILFA